MAVAEAVRTQQAFTLKGSLFTFTVLRLETDCLESLEAQLIDMIEKTPKFFQNMPLVIDLQYLQQKSKSIDFTALKESLLRHHIIPVGVRGGSVELNRQALAAHIAIMPSGKTAADIDLDPIATDTPSNEKASDTRETLFVTRPVRSGQQIYARERDLVVMAPVSGGAELLADGHIHIYGPLRGRALAGVNGNVHARIFCRTLDAELIAIAGRYQIQEELEKRTLPSAPMTQIFLNEDDHLQIEGIE